MFNTTRNYSRQGVLRHMPSFHTSILISFLVLMCLYIIFPTLETYVQPKDPLLSELRQQLSALHPRFSNLELYEGKKSYTLNKKRVYICLKDSNGRYYNRNMLVYVILHEMAHIDCDEIGHTEKFFKLFNTLLQQASAVGLYNPSIPPLKNYCGHS